MNKNIQLIEEIIAVVLLLATMFPLLHYGVLAGIPVPRHFFRGEINAWGDRTVFLYLPIFAWISLSLYLLAVGKLARPLSGVTCALLAAMVIHLVFLFLRQRKA